MFGGIGMQELIVILLIISLLFGAKKIPELARGIGQALREFKKAYKEGKEEEAEAKGEEIKTPDTRPDTGEIRAQESAPEQER